MPPARRRPVSTPTAPLPHVSSGGHPPSYGHTASPRRWSLSRRPVFPIPPAVCLLPLCALRKFCRRSLWAASRVLNRPPQGPSAGSFPVSRADRQAAAVVGAAEFAATEPHSARAVNTRPPAAYQEIPYASYLAILSPSRRGVWNRFSIPSLFAVSIPCQQEWPKTLNRRAKTPRREKTSTED